VACGTEEALAIVRDITEHKLLEKEVLEISGREERRIGQDLHDGLGQQLTGAAFLAKALAQKLAAKGVEESGEAATLARHVNDAVAQTHALARGLFPVIDEPGGLLLALQELTDTVESMFGISCQVTDSPPTLVLDNSVATHLYRIAQEAITNAVKHGRAQHIALSLASDHDRIVLTVQDDGIGFQEAAPKAEAMGLHIMRYRANLIGATLQIEPAKDKGTIVACSLPATSRAGAE
jgi:signal transduction histidine kinase